MAKTILGACLAAALTAPGAAHALSLKSADLKDGAAVAMAQVYPKCGGKNVSPQIDWRGAPAATKSFAVTMFDPDARGGWWHWIVLGIPQSYTGLIRGASARMPAPIMEGTNDFGDAGYDGPCPPPGAPHHYHLTVWALDTAEPPAGSDMTGPVIGPWLERHALAKSELVATFGR
jgi:Raf kinase inhibitor-like YbhB/YbcL family protein